MNSEIRIKQLEERVAYLETIAQSSAHEILTAYINDVAERYGIPCAKGYNRNRTMLVSSNFEIQCKKTISMALGISKISNISHDMLSDARYPIHRKCHRSCHRSCICSPAQLGGKYNAKA